MRSVDIGKETPSLFIWYALPFMCRSICGFILISYSPESNELPEGSLQTLQWSSHFCSLSRFYSISIDVMLVSVRLTVVFTFFNFQVAFSCLMGLAISPMHLIKIKVIELLINWQTRVYMIYIISWILGRRSSRSHQKGRCPTCHYSFFSILLLFGYLDTSERADFIFGSQYCGKPSLRVSNSGCNLLHPLDCFCS